MVFLLMVTCNNIPLSIFSLSFLSLSLSLSLSLPPPPPLFLLLFPSIPPLSPQWMTKSGGEEENLRKAIDFKNKIMSTLNKFQRLKVIYTNPPSSKQPSEDNQEEQLADKPRPRQQLTADEWQFGSSHFSIPHSDIEQDPTTPEAQLARLKRKMDTKER